MPERKAEDPEIVGFIVNHVKEKGWPPTITEISEHCGLARATVAWHLGRLEREGKIVRGDGSMSARARAIRITEEGMKLIPHPMEQF